MIRKHAILIEINKMLATKLDLLPLNENTHQFLKNHTVFKIDKTFKKRT